MGQNATSSPTEAADSSNPQAMDDTSAGVPSEPHTGSPSDASNASTIVENRQANDQAEAEAGEVRKNSQQTESSSSRKSYKQQPAAKSRVDNRRTAHTHLPSKVPIHDPSPRSQPSRPPYRPFADHQGTTTMSNPGPVLPTFGALDDLTFPYATDTLATYLPRLQRQGGKPVPADRVLYSIKVQHYSPGVTVPFTDGLTPLARTPEAAVRRFRMETGPKGLFPERKISTKVHGLDGRVFNGPTIEGVHDSLSDVVFAVILQTWVGKDERSTPEDDIKLETGDGVSGNGSTIKKPKSERADEEGTKSGNGQKGVRASGPMAQIIGLMQVYDRSAVSPYSVPRSRLSLVSTCFGVIVAFFENGQFFKTSSYLLVLSQIITFLSSMLCSLPLWIPSARMGLGMT